MSTHKQHPFKKKCLKKKTDKWADNALVFVFFIFLASLSFMFS